MSHENAHGHGSGHHEESKAKASPFTKDDVFLKEKSNYIMIVRRSGKISDVWKLEDAFVEYKTAAHGWHVVTNRDASFFLTGDIEIWEIPDKHSPLWNMYHAYHEHANKLPYTELFGPKQEDAPKPTTSAPATPPPSAKKKFFRWPYSIQIKWNW